jgi:hypothetical protein
MPVKPKVSSRNGHANLKVPVKDIYLYPLTERFREALHQQLYRKERRKRGGNR